MTKTMSASCGEAATAALRHSDFGPPRRDEETIHSNLLTQSMSADRLIRRGDRCPPALVEIIVTVTQ
jgi:hypothetical protein